MADGFRGGTQAGPQPMVSRTVAPGFYSLGNYRNFNSVILSLLYAGNPVFPLTGDFMLVQLLWFDDFGTILWVDEMELNSAFNPDFSNKRHFISVPVRGPSLFVTVGSGSGGVAGTLDIEVLGSSTVVSRSVFSSDQQFNNVTDNIVLAKGGAGLGAGVASAIFFGGLCSGPVTMTFTAAMGASTLMRLRTKYGTSLIGPPDIDLTGAGTQTATLTVYVPRRPMVVFAQNIAGGASGNFEFNIVRDEP